MRRWTTARSSCSGRCRCWTTTRAESLAARMLEQEHIAYPEAIARVLSGEYRLLRTAVRAQPKVSRPRTRFEVDSPSQASVRNSRTGAGWRRLLSEPISPKACSSQMTTAMMTMMRMICLIVPIHGNEVDQIEQQADDDKRDDDADESRREHAVLLHPLDAGKRSASAADAGKICRCQMPLDFRSPG